MIGIRVGRCVTQVSPASNTGQEQQPVVQRGDSSYSGGSVVDVKESSEEFDVVAWSFAPAPSTQTTEQHPQHLPTIEVDTVDHPTAPPSTATTEVTATPGSDGVAAVDLTATRRLGPVSDEASVNVPGASDDVVAGGAAYTPQTSAAALSEEYRKRYVKYEHLCELITLKDRELAELNDERNKLHRLLVELQREILSRPAATAAPVDGSVKEPPNSREAAVTRDAERDVSGTGTVASTTATTTLTAVPYRHRPAHRGVTSVRVMVKSIQPPTAHSTKINLSRYNALFCNYDEAVDHRRSPKEVAVADRDVAFSTHPTDLTYRNSQRTTNVDSSQEVVQPPASTVLSVEPYLVSDGTASVLYTDAERRSEDVDVGYAGRVVADKSPTRSRMEQVQYERRLEDSFHTSTVSAQQQYVTGRDTTQVVAPQNTVAIGHSSGPFGDYAVTDVSQRSVRQLTDVSTHNRFVVAATNETILSTVGGKRDVDDQRPVILSTVWPKPSLVTSSPAKCRSPGAEVAARWIAEHRELRPPPPYPHRPDLPHLYSAMAAPRPSLREHAAGAKPAHSAAHQAAYAYRKENSAGPRMVYVQPMRAENQDSAVAEPSPGRTDRTTDAVGFRQPCSDLSPRKHVVSDAKFAGNRMSPPALPLRVGVRTAYDQRSVDSIHPSVSQTPTDTHYLHPPMTNDMTQPAYRRNNGGVYHGNHPSTTNAHDVASGHPVDWRPLDQLQHFVDGRRMARDAAEPRVRRLSPPPVMTSGRLNSVDGRSHGPTVVVDYSQRDQSAVTQQVRAADTTTSADFTTYRAQSHFSSCAGAPPPPAPLRRDPRGPALSRASGPAPGVSPLVMTGTRQRYFSSSTQVK